jgi:hypothetical protein
MIEVPAVPAVKGQQRRWSDLLDWLRRRWAELREGLGAVSENNLS